MGFTQKNIVVLNVGRMVEQKAQKDFIEMAKVCSGQNANLRFVLVGTGPLENELQQQVEANQLTECFTFLDFRDDIENIYQASDIVVHCAHWEPLANVLLEARASGRAIVASDVDGSREALQQYPYCDIVEAGNVEALAEKTMAWCHDTPCLKSPTLPKQFTPEGAREQFKRIFPH